MLLHSYTFMFFIHSIQQIFVFGIKSQVCGNNAFQWLLKCLSPFICNELYNLDKYEFLSHNNMIKSLMLMDQSANCTTQDQNLHCPETLRWLQSSYDIIHGPNHYIRAPKFRWELRVIFYILTAPLRLNTSISSAETTSANFSNPLLIVHLVRF